MSAPGELSNEAPAAGDVPAPTTAAEKRPAPEDDAQAAIPKKPRTEEQQEDRFPPGVAPIKPEFIISRAAPKQAVDDDTAEASRHTEGNTAANAEADGNLKPTAKNRGQNKNRKFQFDKDERRLCNSLVRLPREGLFEQTPCEFVDKMVARKEREAQQGRGRKRGRGGRRGRGGKNVDEREVGGEGNDEAAGGAKRETKTEEGQEEAKEAEKPQKCDAEHNLRAYLEAKREDVEGVCPVFEVRGYCAEGWKCRWLKSHVKEENGELVMVHDETKSQAYTTKVAEERIKRCERLGIKFDASSSQEWEKGLPPIGANDDKYGEVVNNVPMSIKIKLRKNQYDLPKSKIYCKWLDETRGQDSKQENRAAYVDSPLRPEEKRKIYIGRETPLLAPLTTTGNLPFRRLCSDFGAALTYSEMAMALPLLQGHKPEWALLRSHASELPTFGAQICANKPEIATKATELITSLLPSAAAPRHGLSLVDLNCGCPIDLVYELGGGSALLDQQGKLSKMLKGMNVVSGATPITVKIRMGTRDAAPTAHKLISRLMSEGDVAAITLHGRSRQQRYSRAADWGYIAEMSTLIDGLKKKAEEQVDTAMDNKDASEKRPVYFIGNGDCYSHVDYFNALNDSRVDSVMLARGALIKPWLFEEISAGQYLDKSGSERLDMVRDYVRYGLECWGSDEHGVATTRRFLLEWLSFTSRYVPIGILERLPPRIQDRPPAWRGRDEVETLLGSGSVKDWIKISEMFLGKVPEGYTFMPKHKSNAYDAEAEG